MNNISLKGKLNLENAKTFTSYDENFVERRIEIARTSGAVDTLPIVISEKLGKVEDEQFISVVGEIRTRNEIVNGKSKLLIFVFAKELKTLDNEEYQNEVQLQGFICKQPIIRETPLGRQISDILCAVNNKYGKSYYIPTIAFGRDSKWIAEQSVGTELSVVGRLQSRGYEKLLENGDKETRRAIELCVKQISKIEKGE